VKDIDLWDLNISAREYIRMAREAKGPDHLHAIFIEARSALSDMDYHFFYEMVEDQAELLIACGGQVVKPVLINKPATGE
jgi:hypothetical protein